MSQDASQENQRLRHIIDGLATGTIKVAKALDGWVSISHNRVVGFAYYSPLDAANAAVDRENKLPPQSKSRGSVGHE